MATVELRGRRILLTGASRGIGTHVALALAQGGAKLVLTARSAEALGAIAARCEAAGAEGVTTIRADLLDADDRGRVLAEAGELDVLINNAGVEYTKRLLAQSDAEVERQLALNLHVPIELSRRVLPGML
ncbi:short-chain dehydrogenase/reductase SDR [Plesiocystis pacifica SIR-1]|uniref:Short-chain dehydrogenase/reductase SDR n=1 Tax=Plesiocystis pacifica SIR-1 TaxID=391625 RepID=A6G603_9BACT|nr:short-chain dehydrogenase/reductase SDR [Plesiocystis pacifica SIR-1]